MIKSIHVENFLCFKDATIDLEGAKGEAVPYALIYGENGSGKTNLLQSVRFLRASLDSYLSKWADRGPGAPDSAGFTMQTLHSEYSRIGSDGPMGLRFVFRINGRDAEYSMRVSKEGLIGEDLVYILNGRRAALFSISDERMDIGKVFKGKYLEDMRYECSKYWGFHSLLSIVSKGTADIKRGFIEDNVAPELMEVLDYINGLVLFFPNARLRPQNPLMNPRGGQWPSELDPVMDALADAMNDFFCGLYSDVEGVRYLKNKGPRYTEYELVFDKRIEGKTVVIPISRESSGTQRLVDEFYYILVCVHGGVVVVDEMDSGVHDVLMMEVFDEIRGCMRGQLIATTHNTVLLQNSDPRNTFIIDLDGEGCRAIRSIRSITKTQKCNNNTKRYLEGDLGGIPIVGYLGLSEVADEFFSKAEGAADGL
jgi:hypothetical protein